MKNLLFLFSAIAGSFGVAFLLLVGMAWLATPVTPAHAQGVVERSRSKQSSDEEVRQRMQQAAKTDGQSAARTFTVSQLFFRQLADVEAEGAKLTKDAGGDAGKIDPALPGAWLMSLECQVFQPMRWVYSQPHAFPTVNPSATDFSEPPYAMGKSDAAEVRKQFLPLLGEPLTAMRYVVCVQLYAELIERASQRLMRGGQLVGGRVVVRDLQVASRAALDAEIASMKFKPATAHLYVNAPVGKGSPCVLPTPSGLEAGQTTFRCAAWEVQQRPLRAVEAGRVVLDEQQALGVQYAFADTTDVRTARSATKTTTHSDAKRRSEDQKARVQVQQP